jgi:hypothetical protein
MIMSVRVQGDIITYKISSMMPTVEEDLETDVRSQLTDPEGNSQYHAYTMSVYKDNVFFGMIDLYVRKHRVMPSFIPRSNMPESIIIGAKRFWMREIDIEGYYRVLGIARRVFRE